ncbi:MAG TPA: OmpH family outer membrane protein [Gemmatimonadaceae bacterium]|nr:OmpH family outer membrane protein [Gemmatimonadaceae bacterium]
MIVRSRGLLAAAVLLLVAAAPLAAQQKLGYVDSRKILQEMPGRAQAEAALRTHIEALGAREKRMVDSLNAMMNAFERDSATLTQAEKVTRFTALQQYDAQYRDTIEVLQAEAEQRQQEAMAPLFDQIRIALEDIRREEGLSMIFDIGAQVNPIVAMDKNLDLSDRVIARIRTMPAARPTAAPSAQRDTTPPAGPVSAPAGVRKP